MTRKREISRPYPPEFVSAETAAYLLDCSRTKFDDLVRLGYLPKAVEVGGLMRWCWEDVRAAVRAMNALATEPADAPTSEPDRFLEGVSRVAAAHA
jgi:predicted DNA-binding transcriptional regulator AlpA